MSDIQPQEQPQERPQEQLQEQQNVDYSNFFFTLNAAILELKHTRVLSDDTAKPLLNAIQRML